MRQFGKKFALGSNEYRQKPNSNDFIKAAEKIRSFLQEEENRKFGKKAKSVSYAYVTKYIYSNYLRGKNIK